MREVYSRIEQGLFSYIFLSLIEKVMSVDIEENILGLGLDQKILGSNDKMAAVQGRKLKSVNIFRAEIVQSKTKIQI